MKYALEGVKVVISMLETADGGKGRFKELIEKMKITEQFLISQSARRPRKKAGKENTPENTVENQSPTPTEEIQQPERGGCVSPVRPAEVGMISKRHRGGKVTPAPG